MDSRLLEKDITYFLVVVRLPFMTRVEVETDLKLPIPPPMLSIPCIPPREEKEVNSAEDEDEDELSNNVSIKIIEILHHSS